MRRITVAFVEAALHAMRATRPTVRLRPGGMEFGDDCYCAQGALCAAGFVPVTNDRVNNYYYQSIDDWCGDPYYANGFRYGFDTPGVQLTLPDAKPDTARAFHAGYRDGERVRRWAEKSEYWYEDDKRNL